MNIDPTTAAIEHSIDGDRLLDEEEDNIEAITRALHARLAETGIARKYHGCECRLMLGEDRCLCSDAHWSWPRKGLDNPEIGVSP